MELPDLNLAASFGLLLAVCLGVSVLTERFHFPKVTIYLLVGLISGPSLLNWIPEDHLHEMAGISDLAMALVLFVLGCHFPIADLRRLLKRSAALSLGEMTATFFAVALILLLFQQSWQMSFLLGALALATAPATTILVLKESASEGPVTSHISTLVALNNFAAIVIFEIVFIGVQLSGDAGEVAAWSQIGWLFHDILMAIAIGVLGGFVVSFGCGLIKQSRWLVLLIAVITLVLGICQMWQLPYMLAFLGMGMLVVNSTDASKQILAEIDHLTGLLCVIFFAVHGAELNVHDVIAAGTVGLLYIVGRVAGKCGGIAFAARLIKEPPQVATWLGPSLLAQAGAAIALSVIAVERNPDVGRPLQTVILGSVVFFELVGPFLIRMSVIRAGEVPLAQAIHHTTTDPLGQLGKMRDRLLLAVGHDVNAKKLHDELLVEKLMRKNVAGIPESASFDEVVQYIEQSHDNTYPVVDEEGAVVGLICYSRLNSALFDPTVGSLVRAEDLSTPAGELLYPDDTVERALEVIRSRPDDCFPVVAREAPHELVGIVRRADVTGMLIRGRK